MFWRWAWLLILGLMLAAGGGYLYSWYQTPIYQASTTVMVVRAPQDKTSEVSYLTDQQLLLTYIQLLKTRRVLDAASQRLGFHVSSNQISVQQISNTQIIQIVVEDPDPIRVALVANMLVDILIEQNEVLQAGRYGLSEESLQTQISEIEERMSTLQSQVSQLPEEDQPDSLLQKTLEMYQQIYLQKLGSLESIRLARLQSIPSVSQIEMASVPTTPVRPQPEKSAFLAGVVGLFVAAGIIFLIEYLDNTLKTPEDVERVLGLPVIGFIPEWKLAGKGKESLYVAKQPRSPASEAFRSLRTNLEYSGVDEPIKTILVTSVGPREGKTTIVANLGAVVAQENKRVTLLDVDMRRPGIHNIFNIPNRVGLSDVFRGRLSLLAVSHNWNGMKNLTVILSGTPPPNPSELLGSDKMVQILTDIRSKAEMIVIDSPPSVVTDALILATKVDAVLFVVKPGSTHADAARASIEQFRRAGARVVGVVLNRIPRNRGEYYGGYKYYSSYYHNRGNPYYSEKTPGPNTAKVPPLEKAPVARSTSVVENPPVVEEKPRPTILLDRIGKK